jgi:cytochrome oxidase Cu insertion factor (SCO1/SenC/PrrC family)
MNPLPAFAFLFLGSHAPLPAQDPKPDPECCDPSEGKTARAGAGEADVAMTIPNTELVDQEGNRVHFYHDLVRGNVVAVNFIFTSCTTICPPLTANFAKLQQLLSDHAPPNFRLITVSVDPVNDTPQRLKAWGEKFGARPGWTFLTGKKSDVDALLKALRVFTPVKEDHSPIVLVGNDETDEWTRIHGLAPPATLAQAVADVARPGERAAPAAPAPHPYFPDVELVDQRGAKLRLYSDLMKDKVVVIDSFFTECTSVCPVMATNFAAIQEALGDRLGKEVHLLSISVDSQTDTTERLEAFAARFGARPGWYFLSGEKENVTAALAKFGFAVESREQHSNLILIGNDRTGLWKKAFGLARAEEIVPIVESVVSDAPR